MTGFFRRLAERALRPVAALHSTTALPFAPAPASSDWLESPATAGEPARPAELPPTRPPVGEAVSRPASPIPAADEEPDRRQLPPRRGRANRTAPPMPEDAPAADSGRRRRSLGEPPPVASDRPTGAVVEVAAAATPVSPPSEPARRSRASFGPTTAAATSGIPARLRARRERPRGDRRADEAAAPEVHIHIDRVELTALPAAAPPRRQPPAQRQPMSLDEYLRRRRGGHGGSLS